MAKCCSTGRCTCRVVAGTGVTVDGNGSPGAPYVVSAEAAGGTAIQAADTPTVDTTVTGTGEPGNPYIVSAAVILDPAPPAGGDNLLQAGPDGLYLECEQVRGCLVAGTGIAYDPDTGEISATGGAAGPLVTEDSTCIALTGDGTADAPLTAAPILDPAPGNALTCGPDGLLVTPGAVSCDDVRPCLSAGDGIAYDADTGEISARPSTDAGNTLGFGTDGGLLVPPAVATSTALQAADTPTVDTTVTGTGAPGDPYEVSAVVVLDPSPPGGGDNLLHAGPDGLFVECADVRGCLTAGDGIAYDPGTGEIAAEPLVTDDTSCIALTGDGTAESPLSAAPVVDPAPGNALSCGPDGLFVTPGAVSCDDVRPCLSAGDGIAYDPGTGEIAARASADAGNTLTFGGDGGLMVPAPAPTALQAADTPTVDTTVTGTGAPGDPYEVSAVVVLDPSPPGGGDNLLHAGPDGLFVECADVRGCLTAGDGAAYDAGTGEIEARLSTEADNTASFGPDGGIYVPPTAPLEIGCGLQGDGTAGTPLAAFPVAGEQPWADDWDCDPAVHSTLKCDPTSGALWTPPEHTSAAVAIQQNHPLGTPTVPVTAFTLVDVNAWSEGTYTADTLSACRGVTFSTRFTGHVELSWPANAQFELGYAVQVNGGTLTVRVLHGVYVNGPARQERYSFGISEAAVLPPHTGHSVRVYPAVRVMAGSVTFLQWITDTDLIALTR